MTAALAVSNLSKKYDSRQAIAFAFWVIQVSKLSVIRLRSDLSNWSLVRQLPTYQSIAA